MGGVLNKRASKLDNDLGKASPHIVHWNPNGHTRFILSVCSRGVFIYIHINCIW